MLKFLITFIIAFGFHLCSYAQLGNLDLSNVYVIINNLRVEGNEKTSENVIFAESKLSVGDSIKVLQLNEDFILSKRNLYNSGLFNDVKISIEKWTDDNEIDIVFSVKERWYLYPSPILELTGITFEEWKNDFDYKSDRISYGLSVSHLNLTGNADRAKIKLKTGFQKQIAGNYLITGLDKKRNWGLGISANYAQNKGLAYDIIDNSLESHILDGQDDIKFKSASVSLIRRKNFNRRHFLSYAVNHIEVPNFIFEELNPNYLPSSQHKYQTVTYGVNIENRNLAEYATSGSSFNGSSSFRKHSDNDLNTFSIGAKYNYYYPFRMRNFLSASISGRYNNSEELPFFHLLNNAPSKSAYPRGYDEYKIIPKSFYTIKTEYRYDLYEHRIEDVPLIPSRFEPINFRILPKTFLDFGATFSDQYIENNTLNNEFLYSYGVGVDVVTIYNTPIILELSRNHLSETSFQFGIGKNF